MSAVPNVILAVLISSVKELTATQQPQEEAPLLFQLEPQEPHDMYLVPLPAAALPPWESCSCEGLCHI